MPQIVMRVLRNRKEQTGRRAREAQMVEADAGKFGYGDGEDGEIDAADAKAECKKADECAGEARDRYGHKQSKPRSEAEINVKGGRRVSAEPHIECMAQRKLARVAHHDVPRDAGVGIVEAEHEDGEQIVPDKEGRCDEQRQHNGQQHEGAARGAVEQSRDHAALLPMMPCGRTSSTRTRMAKANMVFADGVKMSPAMASVSPISTPPTSAPGIEPRPPVITMTKASS